MSEQPRVITPEGVHKGRIIEVMEPIASGNQPGIAVLRFKLSVDGMPDNTAFYSFSGHFSMMYPFWLARDFWTDQPVLYRIKHRQVESRQQIFAIVDRIWYLTWEQPDV